MSNEATRIFDLQNRNHAQKTDAIEYDPHGFSGVNDTSEAAQRARKARKVREDAERQ